MTDTASAYLRTRVLTARPEQLRLMLLEGGLRFLRQAREGLAARNYEVSFDGFSKCRNILIELMNSMKPDVSPELCAKVHALYVFIYQHVVEAGLERNIEKADKAIEMLEFERETWQLAMKQLIEERAAAGGTTGELENRRPPEASRPIDPVDTEIAPARVSLSIQA